MQQDDNPNEHTTPPDAASQPGNEDIPARTAEFDERLRQCEAEFGANDLKVAAILDEYAAFLKKHHLRTLDAANFSARARAIRGVAAPQSLRVEDLDFEGRNAGGDGKIVVGICAALVLVLILSVWLFQGQLRAKDLALEKKAQTSVPDSEQASGELPGADQDAGSSGQIILANRGYPGQRIPFGSFLEDRKTTVFYFHSKYCPSCEKMMPFLERLAEARSDLKICMVDIDRPEADGIDFESPVAVQCDIHSVPQFRIYDTHALLIARDDEARARVKRWMEEAGVIRPQRFSY